MGVGQELTNGLKGVGHVFSFMLKQKKSPPPPHINNDQSLRKGKHNLISFEKKKKLKQQNKTLKRPQTSHVRRPLLLVFSFVKGAVSRLLVHCNNAFLNSLKEVNVC